MSEKIMGYDRNFVFIEEPVVVNKRGPVSCNGLDTVYIGRPSKWGNPYSHLSGTLASFQAQTRAESIILYETWLMNQPHLLAALTELRGKNLQCWCAPLACHGDVLLRLANKL